MPVKFNGKRLKKNNFCKRDEYDFYEIEIPAKIFFSNKRKKYIYSELVKRHPCFSEEYSFDVKYDFRNKKIVGLVVVIHKFILARLHRENTDKPLFVSELPKKRFFCSNQIILIVLLFVLMILLGCVLFLEKRKSVVKNKVDIDKYEVVSEVFVDSNKPLEKTMQLLFLIKEKNWVVSCISWETDGFYEKISVSLENAYPEEFIDSFPDANYSTVIYEEGVPLMQVDLIIPIHNGLEFDKRDYTAGGRDKFRNILLENKALIKEESVLPYRFVFEFEECYDLEKKLYSIFDFILGNDLCIKRIRMQPRNNCFLFDIEFSQFMFFNQLELCSFLRDSDSIFPICKEIEREDSEMLQKKKPLEEVNSMEETKILGIIKRPDGSFFEYYKDKLGKIQKRRVQR